MSRITELTAGTPSSTDVFVFDGAGGTKKVSKFDLLGGFAEKASSPTGGNLASLDENGNLVDSGITSQSVGNHLASQNNPHNVQADQIGAVPTSRTVNGKALNANITLTPDDIGSPSDAEFTPVKASTDVFDSFGLYLDDDGDVCQNDE